MIEIPKLRGFTGPYEDGENYICSAEKDKPLTPAQAAEVIRRAEAKVYRAKMVSSRFDKSTITIRVGEDFWASYEISAGYIDIVEGGGIVPIEQALKEPRNGKEV